MRALSFVSDKDIGTILDIILHYIPVDPDDILTQEDIEDLNDETLEAIKEARDISSGKVKAKEFHSVEELIKDCLSDEADD